MRIHLISHTPLDAPGGVPRFNRYLKRVLEEASHEVKHWSAWTMPDDVRHDQAFMMKYEQEWTIASLLSRYLINKGHVKREDVVIGDGFWCGDFARLGYRRVISVAHGIWGHVTKDDVDAGVQPENPHHHAAQIQHRREHLRHGLPIVAVSEFIAEQMRLQWGFESTVVNNAVDPEELRIHEEPSSWWRAYEDLECNRPVVIVHGVNDRGNLNKGWDHIEACQRLLDSPGKLSNGMNRWPLKMMLLSLDEFHAITGYSDKMMTMGEASICLIPSGYEGNSYFALEAMGSGVPVVAYDVGLFRQIANEGLATGVGVVMPRSQRSPQRTAAGLKLMLTTGRIPRPEQVVEKVASFQSFREGWCDMIERV